MPDPIRRVLVTGQTGLDKGAWVDLLGREIEKETGQPVKVFHTGKMMYEEAPDVAPGRILYIEKGRLDALASLVWERILASVKPGDFVLVNTHATFRWQQGLFSAFEDGERLKRFKPELFLNLVDNCHEVYARCHRQQEHKPSMKDVLHAREEEMVMTRTVSRLICGPGKFALISRGQIEGRSAKTAARMLLHPETKLIYPSFPMTLVMDQPAILKQIDDYVALLCRNLVCFPPGETDEFSAMIAARQAKAEGKPTFSFPVDGAPFEMSADELLSAADDIETQIWIRDLRFIDQVHIVAALYPLDSGGRPALSAGVEKELSHAFFSGKETYAVWFSPKTPSPFVNKYATKVVRSIADLVKVFQQKGYLPDPLDAAVGETREVVAVSS